MDPAKRPLSPHLQVYKPQITSVLSIFHRITGIILSLAVCFIAVWAILLLYGEQASTCFESFMSTWFGELLFALFIVSFFYHLFSGVRHLFWDAGYGFDMETVNRSGWAVVVFTLVATVAYLALFSV